MTKRVKLTDSDQDPLTNSEEEDEGSVSEHSSMPSDTDDVQVNFQARCITDDDYHGIRRLLQQLFPKSPINLSNLTELITKQNLIGSVLKLSLDSEEDKEDKDDNNLTDNDPTDNSTAEDSNNNNNDDITDNNDTDTKTDGLSEEESDIEEDVIGITTLLQIPSSQKDRSCIDELVSYLLVQLKEHCLNEETCKLFTDVLCNGGRAGIVIHERFLNIPMDIGPPMLETMLDEVKEHLKGEEPDHYVLITRSHMEEVLEEEERKRKRKRLESKKTELVIEFEEIDCLKMDSIGSFNYPVPSDCDTVQGGRWGYDDIPFTPYRTVIVIEKEKLYKGITKLLEMFKVPPNTQ